MAPPYGLNPSVTVTMQFKIVDRRLCGHLNHVLSFHSNTNESREEDCLRFNTLILYGHIGPTLRTELPDQGATDFYNLDRGSCENHNHAYVFTNVYGSKEDAFLISHIHFHSMAILALPFDLNP